MHMQVVVGAKEGVASTHILANGWQGFGVQECHLMHNAECLNLTPDTGDTGGVAERLRFAAVD